MIENGLSTFAENPEPTRRTATPGRRIRRWFFQIVAGVTSIAPGWKKAQIAHCLGTCAGSTLGSLTRTANFASGSRRQAGDRHAGSRGSEVAGKEEELEPGVGIRLTG